MGLSGSNFQEQSMTLFEFSIARAFVQLAIDAQERELSEHERIVLATLEPIVARYEFEGK